MSTPQLYRQTTEHVLVVQDCRVRKIVFSRGPGSFSKGQFHGSLKSRNQMAKRNIPGMVPRKNKSADVTQESLSKASLAVALLMVCS
jgi:hypothetical protein